MASPTIRISSVTGSDTATSGAGPGDGVTAGTKLSGSSGQTASNGASVVGRRVTLDGSPNLTNVATDGSHMIFFNDTTTGRRNWSQIEGSGNSGTASAYVDVTQPLGTTPDGTTGTNSITASWAIGGIRGTFYGTTSRRLVNNNNGNGDLPAGSTCLLLGGHDENYGGSTQIAVKRAGDATNGPITIAWDGTGARPILRGQGIYGANGYQVYDSLDILPISNAPSGSRGVQGIAQFAPAIFRNCRIGYPSLRWEIAVTNFIRFSVLDSCDLYASSAGISYVSTADAGGIPIIRNCYVNSSGEGIIISVGGGQAHQGEVSDCLIVAASGRGVSLCTLNTGSRLAVLRNTIICTTYGVELPGTLSTGSWSDSRIENNVIYATGGTGTAGINLSGSGLTTAGLRAFLFVVRNNVIYGFASRFAGFAYLDEIGGSSADPKFINSGSGNYGLGASVGTGLGWPGVVGSGQGAMTSSRDAGASQRKPGSGFATAG